MIPVRGCFRMRFLSLSPIGKQISVGVVACSADVGYTTGKCLQSTYIWICIYKYTGIYCMFTNVFIFTHASTYLYIYTYFYILAFNILSHISTYLNLIIHVCTYLLAILHIHMYTYLCTAISISASPSQSPWVHLCILPNWKSPVIIQTSSVATPTIISWWLNQPIWKICSSNWIMSPGMKHPKNLWVATT